MTNTAKDLQAEALMKALGFSADDLAMNQQGRVAGRQMKQANQWNEQAPLAAVAFAVFWLVFTVALSTRISGAFFVMIPLGLILFGLGYWWHRKLNEALQNPTVKNVSGPIRLQKKTKATAKRTGGGNPGNYADGGVVSASYSLSIEGVSFGITRAAYQALNEYDGVPCRIYYLDMSITRQVLSMEPL